MITDENKDLRKILTNEGVLPDNYPRNKKAFCQQGAKFPISNISSFLGSDSGLVFQT